MLIVFVAAIECLNDIVVFMCGLFDIHDIRLETIFGVVFRPLVLLMGWKFKFFLNGKYNLRCSIFRSWFLRAAVGWKNIFHRIHGLPIACNVKRISRHGARKVRLWRKSKVALRIVRNNYDLCALRFCKYTDNGYHVGHDGRSGAKAQESFFKDFG